MSFLVQGLNLSSPCSRISGLVSWRDVQRTNYI